jgi:hypothetical protein
MATSPHIPLSEYLITSFRPDREYVDCVLVERNAGKNEHSRLQSLLAGWFGSQEDQWQVASLTGCRVQVSPTRVRIPDVLLTTLKPHPEVLIEHPYWSSSSCLRKTVMPRPVRERRTTSTWESRRSGSSIHEFAPAAGVREVSGRNQIALRFPALRSMRA